MEQGGGIRRRIEEEEVGRMRRGKRRRRRNGIREGVEEGEGRGSTVGRGRIRKNEEKGGEGSDPTRREEIEAEEGREGMYEEGG